MEYIAPKIGCVPQLCMYGSEKIEIDNGLRDGVTSDERDHINVLERQVNELAKCYGVSITTFYKRLGVVTSV